ncbi:hypothetical protein [Sporosarcina sp. P1]|nr:hypothetical protein [Sporosarcina sp. P1]
MVNDQLCMERFTRSVRKLTVARETSSNTWTNEVNKAVNVR